jgi:hypothetical protein
MAGCVALALVALSASGSPAAVEVRHAGTVGAVDMAAGTLVVEDVGPLLKSGTSPITRHRVQVSPSTEFTLAKRTAAVGPNGWSGEYVETPLPSREVKTGDYAVVTIDRQNRALKITVVDPREP